MLEKLNLEIDERRSGIAMIVAGVVYLFACNSVLLYIDDRWYLGALLLGPVICLPFVLTTRAAPQQRRAETASWHGPGAIPTSTVSHALAVPVEELDGPLVTLSPHEVLTQPEARAAVRVVGEIGPRKMLAAPESSGGRLWR